VLYTDCPSSNLQDCNVWGIRDGDRSSAYLIVHQASEPVFAPDGRKFAFHRKDGGLRIWNFAERSHEQVVLDGKAIFATWSPAGDQLAYYIEENVRRVHIADVDSMDFAPLTPGMRPSWSPKGDFIAYDSCDGTKCGIFRISPQGTDLRQLTSDGGASAAISPNGKQIAYRVSVAGGYEIFVINADGTERRQLTTSGGGNNVQPAWSPDGAYVFYLSDRGGRGWAVMKMPASGGDKTIVTEVESIGGLWEHQRISVTWYNGTIHAPK
jgi:Tol biopolymer transport system component